MGTYGAPCFELWQQMRIAVFQTFYWTLLVTCINFLAHEEAILIFSILFVAQPGDIISRKSSPELAHVWNKAVDETLGRLVVYLSSRGWWFKHYVEQDMWRRAHGGLWPFSRHCVHMPGMYSTFLYTQSWTSFVWKGSPITYLLWTSWFRNTAHVPQTRV
jgi:hypothetical protein